MSWQENIPYIFSTLILANSFSMMLWFYQLTKGLGLKESKLFPKLYVIKYIYMKIYIISLVCFQFTSINIFYLKLRFLTYFENVTSGRLLLLYFFDQNLLKSTKLWAEHFPMIMFDHHITNSLNVLIFCSHLNCLFDFGVMNSLTCVACLCVFHHNVGNVSSHMLTHPYFLYLCTLISGLKTIFLFWDQSPIHFDLLKI